MSGAFAGRLPDPVYLTVRGPFGRAVVERLRPALAAAGHAVVAEAVDALPAPPPLNGGTPPVGILLAHHDDPAVAEFPATWHRAGLASLAVVEQHPDVRVGPLDVPGTALCARCFARRARQHGSAPIAGGSDATVVLHESVDGFPPYLVALVVPLIVDRLAVLAERDTVRRNDVTVVHIGSLVTRTYPVIAVNDCVDCSGGHDA
jgi:bacteriocin biosynthesis cyclodehydratase domain-containing protein